MLAACDVYRPAAIKQLQINGEKQGVEVFSMESGCQPGADCRRGSYLCKEHGFNVLILDTAGRLHVDIGDDGRTGGDPKVPICVHLD